jgi:hypothetical protein
MTGVSAGDSSSWQDRDVFSGPAVERAVRVAAALPAGVLVRTAFSGFDTGDLIDLEGCSFIAKLPETVSPNPRIYWGKQWFIQGHATGPIEYGPRWVDGYVEETRCWLLDIAVLKNWFADNPSQDVVALSREKSLDPARRWGRSARRLKVPTNCPVAADEGFHLSPASSEQPLRVMEDIPLAAWVLNHREGNYPGVPAIAASSRVACVWFVRFQESFPSDSV